MNRSSPQKPLDWSSVRVLALLGGVFVLGLAANGLSLVQSVITLGFGVGVLVLAWLWQVTLRQARTVPSLTRRQQVLGAVVFVAGLAVGVLVWYVADRAERIQQRQPPATNTLLLQEKQP